MSDTKRNIYIEINGKEVVNTLAGLRKGISQTERDIRNLNRNDKDYQKTLQEHEQRLAALRAEYGRARSEIAQTPSVLQKVKNSLGDVATGFIKAFTITALVASFVAGLQTAWQTVKDFDQAQADLAGILETNRFKILGLTYDAMKLGSTTAFTATQVSAAQLEIAKLGKSIDEIRNMTPGVLNAAIAMGTDLAPAAELVAGQLNAYAESASQSTKYADILSNSTNISATSFESLSTALPKVSKAASVANVSFEKLNATIGVLADENIAAETSGTGFRNILLTAAKAGVPYEQLLEKVKNSTNQLSTATELFGKENAIVAVTLANSTEKIKSQTEALENSAGSAEKLANEKMNSISGDLKLFESALEGFTLGIEKGDGAIGKTARSFIQFGTAVMSAITPTRQLSDELFDQQMEITKLLSQITSSNIKEGERLALIKELNENYPDLISKIDLETMSNEQLIDKLKEINSNYRERIALQLEVEKSDKIREKRDGITKRALEDEARLRERLQKVINNNNYDIVVDFSNVEKTAKEVMDRLKSDGKRTGWLSDFSMIEGLTSSIKAYEVVEKSITAELEKQNEVVNEISKSNNLITEGQRQANAQAKKDLDDLIAKAEKLGGKKGIDFKENEIESIRRYIVIRQAEIEKDANIQSKKDELSKKELARLEKEKERKIRAFEEAEKQIDILIEQSEYNRAMATLKGVQKEIKTIEAKYAQELTKYKDHKNRLAEIEAARDAEIAEVKRAKNVEYMLQQFDIEKQIEEEKEIWRLEKQADAAQTEEERQLLLIDKARYIADLEIQTELEKELAKVENVEMAEDLKQAIRDKYALKKEQNDANFAKAEREIKNKQVDWTRITEAEKLNIARNSLNQAAEAFNEGSAAWKAAKIAEAFMTTYQSATNSYNALAGIPVVGPALGAAAAALAVKSGLANMQRIASTKQPDIPSFYYGGPTGSSLNLGGDQYGKFAGMTHENEWVAPAFMTQNPRYASTLQWLENERKQTLRGEHPRDTAVNDQISAAAIALASAAMELTDTLSNGISAKLLFGYKEANEVNKLQSEMEQSSNFSNL